MMESESTDDSESLPSVIAILASNFDSLFLSLRQLNFQCPSSLQKAH